MVTGGIAQSVSDWLLGWATKVRFSAGAAG